MECYKPNMNLMELQYNITEQDFVDYNIYFIEHDVLTQKTIRKLSLMLAGLVVLGGTALMYVVDSLTPVSVAVYLLLAVVCFFYAPVWFKRKARKNVHRTIQHAVNKHICGPKTLKLTEQGVQLVGESEDSLHPYTAFKRIETAQNQVYLYLDDISALIVPNNAFEQDADRLAFVKLLEDKIAQAKQDAQHAADTPHTDE